MKVLFLDIDGVLNSEQSFMENHARKLDKIDKGELKMGSLEAITEYGYPLGHLYTPYIERLNKIIEQTDAKIVVSSTWRNNDLEDLQSWLTIKGFKHRKSIIDRTPNFQLSYGRGFEILDWLNNHADEVESFAILDDDRDMHHLMPYLVHTRWKTGLQDGETQLAIDLLNGKIDEVPNHEELSLSVIEYYQNIFPNYKPDEMSVLTGHNKTELINYENRRTI